MEDCSWRSLKEGWERLGWARRRWQEKSGAVGGSAADAAISLGMRPNTYHAYERSPDSSKHSEMDHQDAIRFARKFGVRWEWLLVGQGEPFLSEPEPTEPMKRAMSVMKLVPEDQQAAIADAIEALTRAGRRA